MKQSIKKEITAYYHNTFAPKRFVPGKTYIPVSGKVFDQHELANGVAAVLDGWWTEGRFSQKFEKAFCQYLGVKYTSLVNSGSSANLVACSALTSRVFGEKRLQPGDEVITAALGFPTTVNPIIQNGCIPIFVDIDSKTKNPTAETIQKAITPKTKAIMLAHTLGNPLPLTGILSLVQKHNLWFIEDCCDALGSTYKGKLVSTFGHVATFSFYPAHQITMGEGGAVVTNNPLIHQAIRQFRDWGRDCWCDTGQDNTCRRRFAWQLGDLPYGYDHKYIYSQIGYNLKLTDMQAALGLAQLGKLSRFVRKRKQNFKALRNALKGLKYLTFSESEKDADPAWFGFAITVSDDAPFTKLELVTFLEDHKVGTRSIFGGNLLAHPAYKDRNDIHLSTDVPHAVHSMQQSFWIGCFPGITDEMVDYIGKVFQKFMKRFV